MQVTRKEDAGFTLIEVLVCIAIIGIVFMVIMRGFITSSNLNKKAHDNQQATAVAQRTAEEFEANSLSKLKDLYGEPTKVLNYPPGITSDQIAKYGEDLFTSLTYEIKDVQAKDGTYFDVEVMLNPNPYSEINAGASKAAYTNTADIGTYEDMDALKNPVMIGQLNNYDNSIAETFYYQMTEAEIDALGDVSGITDAVAKKEKQLEYIRKSDSLYKHIFVNLKKNGNIGDADCSISASASVKYRFTTGTGRALEEIYAVYSATFPLTYEQGKWTSGGNIYLSLIPFTAKNDSLTINNENYIAESGKEWNVFVVRGMNDADRANAYNLGAVILDYAGTSEIFMSRNTALSAGSLKAAPDNGRKLFDGMYVISNMKGPQGDSPLNAEGELDDVDLSVGDNVDLRRMEIVVKVYEKDALRLGNTPEREEKKIVEFTSTKEVK